MACFNPDSMEYLEDALNASIRQILDDIAAYYELEDCVKTFDVTTPSLHPILPANVGAAIAQKWINRFKTSESRTKLLRLLCYYQLPYQKAVSFNILTTGILAFCHQALTTLQKDYLKKMLGDNAKLYHLAIALAKVLQQALPLEGIKQTIICIRPKYIKASDKIAPSDATGQQLQLVNDIYIPLLSPALLAVGLEASGSSKESNRFNFSVEAGMNQDQASHLIASIDEARDMLELNDQWYRFCKHRTKGRWINDDSDVQAKISALYQDMFKQQTLVVKFPEASGPATLVTQDPPKDVKDTFFEDRFKITPMAIFFQHFVSGDPVQLRLFSDEGSGDASRFEGSSSTSGSYGVSVFRDCHLTPLGSETAFDEKFEVGGHDDKKAEDIKMPDANDTSHRAKRQRRRAKASLERAENYRKARVRNSKEKHADDFFTRLVDEGGRTVMKRMVIRIRVDLFSNEAVGIEEIGNEIYVNNRFFIALTLIHELMHTWFGMDDFHYADIIGNLKVDQKEGVHYSGLVLGKQSAKDTLKALQDDDHYPTGTRFKLDDYTWQINNVDNYVATINKVYFLDEVMCKYQAKHGYPKALEEKAALAKTRLAYLAAYNVHHKPDKVQMDRLLAAEQDCWVRKNGDYNELMKTMVAGNAHVKRFSL